MTTDKRETERSSSAAPAAAPIDAQTFDHVAHYRADGEFFDYEAEVAFAPDERRRRQTILDLSGARAGERILDVGSGSGWLSRALAARGCRVVALDLSLRNLRDVTGGAGENGAPGARAPGAGRGGVAGGGRDARGRVHPVLGETALPPFASDAFNRVIAIEVIEHLVDPARALREMGRVLAPGGSLVVAVPYNERIEYNICIHCNRPTPKSAHLHSFTRARLRELIASAGFSIESERLFLNKGISLLRLNALLGWAPVALWRGLDGVANALTDRVRHIGIVARNVAAPSGGSGRRN